MAENKYDFVTRLSKMVAKLQTDAYAAGLPMTARALNAAMNVSGWEASGNLSAAEKAAHGERP